MRATGTWRPAAVVAAGVLFAVFIAGAARAEAAHEQAAQSEIRTHGEQDEANEEHQRETVQLSPEVLNEFDIRIDTAGPGWIEKSVVLPAEVRPNQDRLAHRVWPGITSQRSRPDSGRIHSARKE